MRKSRDMGIGIVFAMLLVVLFAMPSALADSLNVTSPNTAVNWSGTQSVTWGTVVTSDVTNDTFNVSYSDDGGASYNSIITGLLAANRTYSWNTVGRTDGALYRINVTKHNTYIADVYDTSDVNFTVDNLAPVVAITMTSSGLRGSYVDTTSSTLTFSGTMTDETSGNYNITVGGTAGTLSANTWTATSVSISDGCNVVTAIGFDYAGNSHSVTKTVCKSKAKTGSYEPPTPTPYYQPPASRLPTLSIIPEEGLPDEVKKLGVIAVMAIVVFLVWRGSGSKPKRRRRK